MKYISLLRGINVGGNRKVEMKRLKSLFESMGFADVNTYLNSGNVFFSTGEKRNSLQKEINLKLKDEFGFEIQTLVKSQAEIINIVKAVPDTWQNDSDQKTDVAFLFDEIDSAETIDVLPVKKEFIDIRYVKGAIFWNIDRKLYNRSQMNKLASHRIYQLMTVRNINTARYLAEN
ncbi:MAG: DUF1697 domain-containing protein [Spirochaetes bacterium]|nr:DUF1697 domain-containing protein [Spirochaetota bacterium]